MLELVDCVCDELDNVRLDSLETDCELDDTEELDFDRLDVDNELLLESLNVLEELDTLEDDLVDELFEELDELEALDEDELELVSSNAEIKKLEPDEFATMLPRLLSLVTKWNCLIGRTFPPFVVSVS
jgi:hypothetical protein